MAATSHPLATDAAVLLFIHPIAAQITPLITVQEERQRRPPQNGIVIKGLVKFHKIARMR